MTECDETGARICAAGYRKDVLAIRDGAVMMASSMLTPRMRMLVGLLASTYYWPWPSQTFILRIVGLGTKEPGKDTLLRIGQEVFDQFSALRVLDGSLIASARKGISSTKNPSERRCGSIKFKEILEDLPAVLKMLMRALEYFVENKVVSVAKLLETFGKSCIYTKVPTYKNVRCCRILIEHAGKDFRGSIEDFQVFSKMSPRLGIALKSRGIVDYDTASRFVKGMQQVTGLKKYCLNDLIVYTCLLDRVVFDD